jgi:hypothetical protein
MNVRYLIGGILASLSLALLGAPVAFATPHTSMYPVGDSISASSVPVTIENSEKKVIDSCTLNGGVFTIPASGFKEGQFHVTFTTDPSFTSCTKPITTSGAWAMTTEYPSGQLRLTVPADGLIISPGCGKECEYLTINAMTFPLGNWNNGFTSPVSVGSTMQWGGGIRMKVSIGELTITFSESLFTLTDVTHPSSLPVLGP